MPIRLYRASDAARLRDITLAAITAIGSRRYGPRQIAAWAAAHRDPARFDMRAAKGDRIFVFVDEKDHAAGFALLETGGHLDMLYCHPDRSRGPIAGALLAYCENEARGIGCERIFTEASELARPAFERAGFTMLRRRDFAIAHEGNDIPIHNYAMEKILDPG